ncbi:MAG: hypothetical protein AB7O26_16605 [Planctomycetaceae bacterium]
MVHGISKSDDSRRKRRLILGIVLLLVFAGTAHAAHTKYREYCDQQSLAALEAAGLQLTQRGVLLVISDPTRKCATDECCRHIGDLNRKIGVSFNNCMQITDTGLAHLKGHNQLCLLALHRTGITDAGLESLSGMTALESLDLSHTAVSDQGVAGMADGRFDKLMDLNLVSTRVTDAAIDGLGQVPSLRYVVLERTGVTPEGVRKLRSANPEVIVLGLR